LAEWRVGCAYLFEDLIELIEGSLFFVARLGVDIGLGGELSVCVEEGFCLCALLSMSFVVCGL
jgi:hypothetical protein